MTRNKPRTRNQIKIDQKYNLKITEIKGQVGLGRTTFINEIIHKLKSQASVGPQVISGKGSTIIAPQVPKSFIASNDEIHDENLGSKQSFQDISVRHISPFDKGEGCYYNLREQKGEMSEPYPQPSEKESPTTPIMRNGKTKGVQKWYSKQQLTISNKMVFN